MAIIADTPDMNFPIVATPLGGLDGQTQHYSEKEGDAKIKVRYAGRAAAHEPIRNSRYNPGSEKYRAVSK